MRFSEALEAVIAGRRAYRSTWNSTDQFIYYVPGSRFKANRPPLLGIYPEGTEIEYRAHIDIRTKQGSCVPWLASQSDLLEDDWVLLPED